MPRIEVRQWMWAGLLIIAVLLAYMPAMQCGFIWDDDAWLENPLLEQPHSLWRIWFEPRASQQYYPLTFTSFWLEYQLWGLQPFGYHVNNILLHCGNALLFWWVLRRLRLPNAPIAAAMFALHPVHVESVAWITERKNVLSTGFYLAAGLVYLRYIEHDPSLLSYRRRLGYYLSMICLFFAALLSKTVTCTFPVVMAGLLWQQGKLRWRNLYPLIPMVLLSVMMGGITWWMEYYHLGAQNATLAFSALERILIAGRIFWFYVRQIVWPGMIVFYYPRWTIDATHWWQYLYPLSIVLLMGVLWRFRERLGKWPLFSLFYLLVTYFPTSGVLNVYYMTFSFVADHFMYLPGLGIIATLVAGLERLFQVSRTPQIWRNALYVTILSMFALRVWNESYKYMDNSTLWHDTLVKNPAAVAAHYNLATSLFAQGQLAQALPHYEAVVHLDPQSVWAQNNLGVLLAAMGRFDEARRHYAEALRIDPHSAFTYNNIGTALLAQGQTAEAITALQEAVRLSPEYAEAYHNLGVAWTIQGNVTNALQCYVEALRLNPEYEKSKAQLVVLLNVPENYRLAVRIAEAYARTGDAMRAQFFKQMLRAYQSTENTL